MLETSVTLESVAVVHHVFACGAPQSIFGSTPLEPPRFLEDQCSKLWGR